MTALEPAPNVQESCRERNRFAERGVAMALLQRLEMRQGQSLVMTPQLLQAIKLLQLSNVELEAYVEAEPDPVAAGSEAPGAGEGWSEHGVPPSRAEIERELDAPLDNLFPDENPVPARVADSDADSVPLADSPWTSGGLRNSDEVGPGLEATLTRETSLAEHLEHQLDLAT